MNLHQTPRHAGSRWLLRTLAAIFASLFVFLALATMVQPLSAQTEPPPPLRVVIKPLVPFVFPKTGDSYQGFSIDLWQEIARRMDRNYEYQYVDTVTDQLDAVEQKRADIAITGISITKSREETIDFSQPYFEAGLQIMTAQPSSSQWTTPFTLARGLIESRSFWTIIIILFVLIVVMGHTFWLLERRRNPDFPSSYLRGVWEGIWYTVVTLVTVGYGDRTAKTIVGRLLAMFWMFISLLLVATFTANITSQLTLSRIEGIINGPGDLAGKRLATVANSTAAQYLDEQRLPYTRVGVVEDAYALLENGTVDAVVYDSPVLLYYAATGGLNRVNVVGEIFEPQDYGIAMPEDSPEREMINRALLDIFEDGTYWQIYDRWFTVTGDS